ncbi:BTB/POZ domain-containing protein [Cocos nucifera]|uniref:BTB/POZ domain-containing protein n=1 Tax=Cocos nucifera TaxID=13894 RepID=A0A8K0IQS1_COCNU|nr:BTB/POZ domain-containing protein [Cocos nucifera]
MRKWKCMDAEIQAHALKTMTGFINCLSFSLLQHPIIKDSIFEMLVALEGILQAENERTLNLAADVTLQLVRSLGKSICQYPMLEVIISLSHLLSLCRLPVGISSAIALNCILTNLGPMRFKSHKEVWNVLKKAGTVGNLIHAFEDFEDQVQSPEYFTEMTSLLKTILWRWPLSRYHVWNNTRMLAKLGDYCANSDTSVVVSVLEVYTVLALCGNGAMKLLERKELLFQIVQSMGKMHDYSVRVKALTVLQHLTRSAKGCTMVTTSYCEPVIRGIIDAMGEWRSSNSKKIPTDQMALVMEACRSASLTCWAGNHHSCFWNHDIHIILLDIILGNCSTICLTHLAPSSQELIARVNDNVTNARPYVWDILGNLVVHYEEDFLPRAGGNLCYLNILISCACSVAADLMQKCCNSSSSYMSELEPVLRAVLLMVFSSSKCIQRQVRHCLSDMVRPFGDAYLKYILASLQLNATGEVSLLSDSLRAVNNLMSLACYSTLPLYQKLIVKSKGIEILSAIIKMCLNSDIHVSRSSIASHLHSSSDGKTCCWSHVGHWEGEDILLFYSLQTLSQLIEFSNLSCNHHKLTSGEIVICTMCEHSGSQDLINSLQYILSNIFGSGPRWYSAHILSFFGFYGFPSKIGKKMERALHEDVLADLELLLSNGQSLTVHGAILAARCPYLLPPKESFQKEKTWGDGSSKEQESRKDEGRSRREVRMSDRVDGGALKKILDYVYTGFIHVDDDLAKPLKILAKCCGLRSLSDMLHRKLPKWGTSSPSCDFIGALEPAGHLLSDVILEARAAEGRIWSCTLCQSSSPHMHAHKIVLCSSSDYLRALFQSGMHDSHSQIIKVPVGWEALVKLGSWFYSGELPSISIDCIWSNMDAEQQLHELQAYVELSSLAEFWCLEDVGEQSLKVVVSCLKSDKRSSVEIISFAASIGQWKIVEAGVNSIAPLYPKLLDAGELEDLDEEVLDMLRSGYVCYSQGSCKWSD